MFAVSSNCFEVKSFLSSLLAKMFIGQPMINPLYFEGLPIVYFKGSLVEFSKL